VHEFSARVLLFVYISTCHSLGVNLQCLWWRQDEGTIVCMLVVAFWHSLVIGVLSKGNRVLHAMQAQPSLVTFVFPTMP
jgi:hypothetical protein